MASSTPCHAGVLPRPKKELVGRKIQYYVDRPGERVVFSFRAER